MLFNSIVYGPIHSRRLGLSLGVNLMPTDLKVCTFDCIYCECGANQDLRGRIVKMPSCQDVKTELEHKLRSMQTESLTPDVITFSGNGEPTMHKEFESIIDDTIELRNTYCPTAKISVLSNSTQLFRPDVRRALMRIDNRILKLDSALTPTMRLIDRPVSKQLTVEQIVDYLKMFDGDFTLQTCFLRGMVETDDEKIVMVDNSTPVEVEAWLQLLPHIRPKDIMIYVIDRATPVKSLEKISPDKMESIAQSARSMGFHVSVSA